MARVYVLRRDPDAAPLADVGVAVWFLVSSEDRYGDEDVHKAFAPLLSVGEFVRRCWIVPHAYDGAAWTEALKKLIRDREREATKEDLIVHACARQMPRDFKAWLFMHGMVDDESTAPFYVKVVIHEKVDGKWVITAKNNL